MRKLKVGDKIYNRGRGEVGTVCECDPKDKVMPYRLKYSNGYRYWARIEELVDTDSLDYILGVDND